MEGQKATVAWKAIIKLEAKAADIWQILDTFTYSISVK
jgi:hypothetical protein